MVQEIKFYKNCFRCNMSFKISGNSCCESDYRLIYANSECYLCNNCSIELTHFLKNTKIEKKNEKVKYRFYYDIIRKGVGVGTGHSDISMTELDCNISIEVLKRVEELIPNELKKEVCYKDGDAVSLLSWSRIHE